MISGMENVSWDYSLFTQKFFSPSEHWCSPPSWRSVLVKSSARDKKYLLITSAVKVFGTVRSFETDVFVSAFTAFQINFQSKPFWPALPYLMSSLFIKVEVVLLFLEYIPLFHGLADVICELGQLWWLYLISFTKLHRNFQTNCYLFVIQGKKTL